MKKVLIYTLAISTFWSVLFLPDLSAAPKSDIHNYILGLRSSRIQDRRLVLLELKKHLSELRRRSTWPKSSVSLKAQKALVSYQSEPQLIRGLQRCLKVRSLQSLAISCLGQLGGDQAATTLYQLVRQVGSKPAAGALLEVGAGGSKYLATLLALGKAAGFEEKYYQALQKHPEMDALPALLILLGKPKNNHPQLLQKTFLAYGKKAVPSLQKEILRLDQYSKSKEPALQASLRATLILGRIGGKEVFPFLKKRFEDAKTILEWGVILQAMGEGGGERSETFLIQQAQNKDHQVELSCSAIHGLGYNQGKKGLEYLLKVAQTTGKGDRIKKQRRFAIQALSRRKAKEALDVFKQALFDPHPTIVREGLYGIYRLADPKGWNEVTKFYNQTKVSELKVDAVHTLARLNHPQRVSFLLESLAQSKDKTLSRAILSNLRRFPGPKVDEVMVKAALHKSEKRRILAQRYLQGRSLKLYGQTLLDGLLSKDKEVVDEVVGLLVKLAGKVELKVSKEQRNAVTQMLLAASSDDQKELIQLAGLVQAKQSLRHLTGMAYITTSPDSRRILAIRSIAKIGGANALSALKQLSQVKDEPQRAIRYAAIESMGHLPYDQVSPLLEKLWTSPKMEVRMAVLSAYSLLGTAGSAKFLTTVLLDDKRNRRERVKAAKGLMQNGKMAKAHAYDLLQATKGRDASYVRFVGARILAQWGTARDIIRLQKFVQSQAKKDRNLVRLIGTLSLYQVGKSYRQTATGTEVIQFLEELQNNIEKRKLKEIKGKVADQIFDLQTRVYRPSSLIISPLIQFVSKMDIKDLYLLDLKRFSNLAGLDNQTMPSTVTGREVVIYSRRKSSILVLKKMDKKGWVVWGGGGGGG